MPPAYVRNQQISWLEIIAERGRPPELKSARVELPGATRLERFWRARPQPARRRPVRRRRLARRPRLADHQPSLRKLAKRKLAKRNLARRKLEMEKEARRLGRD